MNNAVALQQQNASYSAASAKETPRLSFSARAVSDEWRKGRTLYRSYMNAAAKSVQLYGPVLDVGAGGRGSSSYHKIIPRFDQERVVSIDIDARSRPSLVGNVEHPFPFPDGYFGTTIAFNLLEHTYHFRQVLREMARVLKPEGVMYLAVPFLVRVHGHPDDYFRYTSSALRRVLAEEGLNMDQALPCGAGAFTGALAQIDFVVPAVMRRVVLRLAWLFDRAIQARAKIRNADDYPLLYLVSARKLGPFDRGTDSPIRRHSGA